MRFTLLFACLIVNSVSISMENKQQLSIDSYLNCNKTRMIIGTYQKVWETNHKKLRTKNKLKQGDNLEYIIRHVTQSKPSGILTDADALTIAKQIVADSIYLGRYQNAKKLTKEHKEQEARAAWSKCHYRVSELCKYKLAKQRVSLDIPSTRR